MQYNAALIVRWFPIFVSQFERFIEMHFGSMYEEVRVYHTLVIPTKSGIGSKSLNGVSTFALLPLISSLYLLHSVRARIVSFGGVLAVPWKTYLVLDCLHVGEPAPSIQWQHEGAAIQENSKYQVR